MQWSGDVEQENKWRGFTELQTIESILWGPLQRYNVTVLQETIWVKALGTVTALQKTLGVGL